jgi:hypothetical protein
VSECLGLVALFLKLMIGHFLADYPLQPDFLARAKNHKAPMPGVPWWQALVAHSAIHAGIVWAITGRGSFALAEFFLHAVIDYGKCERLYGFNADQVTHAFCKLLYARVIFFGWL